MLCSCSADFYHEKADLETQAVLFGKTDCVDNVEDESLDISSPQEWDKSELKKRPAGSLKFLGEYANEERGARLMSLDKALETGITYNRSYLAQKESVFLTALDLTLAQHRLSPIFGGGGDVTRQSDSRRAAAGLTDLVATNTFARDQEANFDMLLKTGARLSTDFTQDFLNFMSGSRDINNSSLAVTLIQPLLKGGGTKATLEALTQADRDVLYSLRDFANFRRNFIVDLVGDYYSVLQARDNAFNAYLAYEGFLKNVEREEALKDEARRTLTQLGQLQQALLLSESRWLTSIRTYETRLDQFKLTLGIPVEENIVLDDKELDYLKIERVGISKDEAIKIALVCRPDIETSRDRIDDAGRRIEVAKNGLKAGLDIRVDYETISEPGDRTPDLNFDRRNISSNLDLDLPLDRKSERNIYRSSLITKELRERQHEENVDKVRLQIYDDWRALELARKNYEIALKGVALAQLRLDEQNLLFELGNGEARDLVDAQNDLVNAQNQRISTLIDHTLARLRLWRDLGILYIKPDGSWIEKLEKESAFARKLR
ncbi:MAG: TolC family protein [Verrucomicrobiales bacterium]|nr:TolC family protein [Verrucomicrobiales bacterium]